MSSLYDFTPEQREAVAHLESLLMQHRARLQHPLPVAADAINPPVVADAVTGNPDVPRPGEDGEPPLMSVFAENVCLVLVWLGAVLIAAARLGGLL